MSNEEIVVIIHSLKNKSSGPSSIPLKMLLIIPDLIILPLARIINMSIFIKMNTMNVEGIYKYQVAKFVFKCLNQNTPVQFHNWYKLNHLIHGHLTRSNFNVNDGVVIENLFIPSIHTTKYG